MTGAMVSYSSHKLGIVSLILASIAIIDGSIQVAVVLTSLTILVHHQW